MIATTEFRGGAKIEIDGEPFLIVECQHVKPGKGGAFVRTRLKSLLSGNVIEKNIRSGEKFEEPDLQEREVQFLYSQGEGGEFHFMDTRTYEQFFLSGEQLGDSKDFLKENMVAKILFYKGGPIAVDLPVFVDLKVVSTDPGVRGDTASGGTKSAVLETGAVVKVPLYIEEGTRIRIDTRSRTYVERAKSSG